MEIQKVNERIAIRSELLEELYDYHFENEGREKFINIDELKSKGVERYLALEYLIKKGLVATKPIGDNLDCKITIYGIDIVESGKLS